MKTLKERFEEKFIKKSHDECWEWIAFRDKCGYGRIGNGPKLLTAHRVSYGLYKGDPGKLHVCHKCDNPACVNPDHLFLGTYRDNMDDMVRKGRARKKISLDQKAIIEEAIMAGYNCSEIGRYFKVTHNSIVNIKKALPGNVSKPYWSRRPKTLKPSSREPVNF